MAKNVLFFWFVLKGDGAENGMRKCHVCIEFVHVEPT